MQFLIETDVQNILRNLFATLCQFIYKSIAWLYELFINISKVKILSSDDIHPIYQRITMILAIIMIFYVTFEFVKFVVQPDGLTDKEKGAGNIVQRMIIVVVLIAFVPNIFELAYDVQNVIFENQLISKIVSGRQDISYGDDGKYFASNMFAMFYKFDSDEWIELGEDPDKLKCEDLPCRDVVSMNLGMLQDNGKMPLLHYGLNGKKNVKNPSINNKKDKLYYISFDGIFAIIAGGFTMYILALYCVDAGVRIAQLAFLQIIAPIPIIGYLAPKKDGIFQKWYKQCFTTYLDLFIRLAVIHFILLLCDILSNAYANGTLIDASMTQTSSDSMIVLVYIALIMGLLLFAKKAPDMLKELFPKSGAASGNFGLKGGERIAPLAARAAGAALGATTGIRTAAARGIAAAKRNRTNRRTGERAEAKEGLKDARTNRKASRAENRQRMRAARRNRRAGYYTTDEYEYETDGKGGFKLDKDGNKIIKRDANGNPIHKQRQATTAAERKKAREEYRQVQKEVQRERADREEEYRSAKAARDNTRYRTVAGQTAAGLVGGTVRGAVTGSTLNKIDSIGDIRKKMQEVESNETKRNQELEKWYDSGGGSFIDRSISQFEKGLGVDTQSARIEDRIKYYDGLIKSNETYSKIEADTKARRDEAESRLTSKIEAGELKNKVNFTQAADGSRTIHGVKEPLEIHDDDTYSTLYARYAAKRTAAEAEVTAAQQSGDQARIARAQQEVAHARTLETAVKKHTMRNAMTDTMRNPNSSDNDAVAVGKIENAKTALEVARRNRSTVQKFEAATDKACSDAIEAAKAEAETEARKAGKSQDEIDAIVSRLDVSSIKKKFEEQKRLFLGSKSFAESDYDELDDVVVRLNNIADDRHRENSGYSESRRKLQDSDRTSAAKADDQFNPPGGGH